MKSQQKAERRAWVRYEAEQDASYRVFGNADEKVFAAQLHDVSASGLGLVANLAFAAGAVLNVCVECSGPGLDRPLLVRVRQSSALPDGSWLLGCKLITELNGDELDALTEA